MSSSTAQAEPAVPVREIKSGAAAIWLLLAGISLRVLSFFYSENTGGDAWAREALTSAWLRHPSWNLIFDAWLPLHFWLMAGLALLLEGNVRLAGRLLSLLFGIGCIYVLWKLAAEVYGRRSALFSLAIFAFYSLHIAYSTTSSSEATYLFFVLGGLFYFFRYQNHGGLAALAVAGISLSMASAVRYEAWVITFVVGLLLLAVIWRTKPWDSLRAFKALLLFGATAGLWPAILMAYNLKHFGHPLYSVTMNYTWVSEQLSFAQRSFAYRLTLFPGVILITLTPIIVAAALYGLYKSFSGQPSANFAILLLLFGAIQLYQILSGGQMAFARYTLSVGTLLTIVAGYGLSLFEQHLHPDRRKLVFSGVLALVILNTGCIFLFSETKNRLSEKFASISPRLRYTEHVETVGAYLRSHLQPTESVVIDDYNSEALIVAQASGLPLPVGTRAFLVGTTRPISEVKSFVQNQRPKYLVYSDRGAVHTIFALPPACTPATNEGLSFQCVFSNEVYKIYEIRYPS